ISIGLLTQVLKELSKEKVPIRDLTTILETIDASVREDITTPSELAEACRVELGRSIVADYLQEDSKLHVLRLEPEVLEESPRGGSSVSSSLPESVFEKIEDALSEYDSQDLDPVLLTRNPDRADIAQLLRREGINRPVLAEREIPGDIEVIELDRVS
ncbi:MAG: FHIPEP family type III secretion protein, partial [bacterium]